MENYAENMENLDIQGLQRAKVFPRLWKTFLKTLSSLF
jgi:hypothetical protein